MKMSGLKKLPDLLYLLPQETVDEKKGNRKNYIQTVYFGYM
jgi:hypothetical protein